MEWIKFIFQFIIVGIVLVVLGICSVKCINKYFIGNKTFIDLNNNFKYAYIDIEGKCVKIEIKCWKDWDNSDAIQVMDVNGCVYYTHLNRVILTNK